MFWVWLSFVEFFIAAISPGIKGKRELSTKKCHFDQRFWVDWSTRMSHDVCVYIY
jgi:hypothetical protein